MKLLSVINEKHVDSPNFKFFENNNNYDKINIKSYPKITLDSLLLSNDLINNFDVVIKKFYNNLKKDLYNLKYDFDFNPYYEISKEYEFGGKQIFNKIKEISEYLIQLQNNYEREKEKYLDNRNKNWLNQFISYVEAKQMLNKLIETEYLCSIFLLIKHDEYEKFLCQNDLYNTIVERIDTNNKKFCCLHMICLKENLDEYTNFYKKEKYRIFGENELGDFIHDYEYLNNSNVEFYKYSKELVKEFYKKYFEIKILSTIVEQNLEHGIVDNMSLYLLYNEDMDISFLNNYDNIKYLILDINL